MNDPTGRALTLLSLLQTHRYWPGGELADRLGVTERTVRRDVDRLRDLGYPVEATPGVGGGYQLAAGTHLPPLLVDDDEAVALAVGLRAAAGASIEGIEDTTLRVMAKLEQILPDRLRRRVDALNSNLETLRWTSRDTVPAASLGVLAAACRDREEVRFDYTRRDGEASSRLVRPHQLVTVGQRWYLVAWDVRRSDWRTFRIDRMENPRVAGLRFEPMDLPAKSAAAFVEAGLQSLNLTFEATVTVTAPADRIEETNRWFGAQMELESLGADRHRLILRAEALEWLVAMIAIMATSYPIEIEDAPPEASQLISTAASRLSSAPPLYT